MLEKLKSRKFWMAVVSAGIIIANQGLGLNLPEEATVSIAGIAISYIFAQAGIDKQNSR